MDAKAILDALIAGSSQSAAPVREHSDNLGGLGDVMRDIFSQSGSAAGSGARNVDPRQMSPSGGQGMGLPPGLDQIFKDMMGTGRDGGHGGQSRTARERSSGRDYSSKERYDDVMGQFGEGQKGVGDLFGTARDFIRKNPQTATAILGGLGGLLLGTRTGRNVLGRAARLGGLALIGTLAYKAFKNYSQGVNIPSGSSGADTQDIDFSLPDEQPPAGSGFEPASISGDEAVLMLRAMIAAAAIDGEVSNDERQAILENLQQVGFDQEAAEFIRDEFDNPASIEQLADDVPDEQTGAKVYTAARIVIDPDTYDEQRFLEDLADALNLDPRLVANIDAATGHARG